MVGRPYRTALDLGLLRRGDGAIRAIREDLRVIVATPVPPDAVDFDSEHLRLEAIRFGERRPAHSGQDALVASTKGQKRRVKARRPVTTNSSKPGAAFTRGTT